MSALPPIHDARFVASAVEVEGLPAPTFAEIAFAGRSNVGKSSLINALLQRNKLVRTSSTPGCTRGLNLFRVDLGQGSFDLVDLPGYGYAERSKQERRAWGQMIEGFLTRRSGLRAVVLILDVRREPTDDDRQLLAFLAHVGRPVLCVATKVDKLAKNARAPALAALGKALGLKVYAFSAHTGEGRETLLRAILAALGVS
jgi:GTP-binding protein